MATTKTKAADEIVFVEFAPTAIPIEGSILVGKFKRLQSGPENEFGIPIIVIFEGVSGKYRDNDGTIFDIVAGTEYSLWLIHTVLRNHMAEERPVEGERFAVKYNGLRKPKAGSKFDRDYHDFALALPDRPVTAGSSVSWDEVPSE